MATGSRNTFTTSLCPFCGQRHRSVPVPAGSAARCIRCDSELWRRPRLGPEAALALSLAGLACWALALALPVASVEKLGRSRQTRLLAIGDDFRQHGQFLLSVVVDLAVVVLPSMLFALLPILAASAMANLPFRGLGLARRAAASAKRWAMPEVYLLAILVAFVKLGELAQARIESGFWMLAGAVGLTTICLQLLEPAAGQGSLSRPRPRRAWAFLAAAAIMLVPANLLPIMTISLPGGATQQTILGGIASLAGDGAWAVAAIVFAASILVPFSKLGGLVWLIMLARRKRGSPFAVRAYRALDFIGRWSMLDIFLIGFLAGLVDFGDFASLRPGPAAPAFAAAVILTVIAVESFDTKTLWPDHGQQPRP